MRRAAALLWLALGMTAAGNAYAAPHISVQVEGVSGAMLKNVTDYLSIVTYENSPDLSQSLVERLNARAPDEIQRALQPFGYYDSKVDAALTSEGDSWVARYVITLPPPVRIRHIDILLSGEGDQDPAYDDFIAKLPYASGTQLEQKAYEDSKRNLLLLASQRGYIDARFIETRLAVNPQEHWADITLRFSTGPRYYFGQVSFVQDFMDPAFLARYVKFKPGDPFDNEALLKLQYALNDSGYFNAVNVESQRRPDAEHRIPIRVTLSKRPPNAYTFGLGYGTDTGPRATLGWTDRRVNDEGHSFSAQTQISHVMETVLLSYTVPLSDPASDRLIYSLGNLRQTQLGSFTSYTTMLGASRAVTLGQWNDSQYLQLEHDRSDLQNVSTNSTLLMPGLALSRLESDDLVLPTRGYRVSADLHGASNAFFSDTTFLQFHLAAKLILPLGDDTRLLLRGEAGATAVKSFTELPATQRFFAGGDQSVRGFEYNSLGVRDAQGENLGGKDLTVGSIEVDHFFGKIFGIDAFIDAGDANNSFTSSLEKGIGAGLRWRTPVGMIRLDVAHPVKRPDLDRVRVHISLGPDL
ncbi:MAG TPA: autotransporter assembly complex family protein [Gammaproteobacteria bacterium]|jgi:translocation and assembly module TamA|nr:autotransporter assembly complex family protein [Gammaproteobacteria bacterium]